MLELSSTKSAFHEWNKLDPSARKLLKKKLLRQKSSGLPGIRLRGFGGVLFKIKITNPQFRLVYRIDEEKSTLIVIAVGHRDSVYEKLTDQH